jgi:hypothetical protein
MAYDGIKIKITAEDDASAAFEKVRANIISSFRDLDDAGDIIGGLADGLATLGDEFGSSGAAAGKFAGALSKSTASASGLAAEIATMASGLKDVGTLGVDIARSNWFQMLFSGGGRGALSVLGSVGIGAGVAAGGAAALTVGGAAYGGLKLYEDYHNEQQRRNAGAPVGLGDRQFREFVGGAREDLGHEFVNSVLNDPKLDRLRGFGSGNDAYREKVASRFTAEAERRAAERESQKSEREQQRQAAIAEKMKQTGIFSKYEQGLAERVHADDPLKLLEMQLRLQGANEQMIKGIVQQERDWLKIEKDKATEQEKQNELAEKRSEIDRRMGTAADAWKERSMTAQEKQNRDELEVLGLMMSGRINERQYQKIMDSIAIDYTKPDAKGKPDKVQLDLGGGDNSYESRFATRAPGTVSQLDVLKKLLTELKDGNHKQRLEAKMLTDWLERNGIVLGPQGI